MISSPNGSKWGIKDTGVNFTPEVHNIIDNAKSFIVICGYNFSPFNNKSSVISRLILRQISGVKVLLITPPDMWGFGKAKHTNNIQYLVSNGIGVILNTNNHSKWILSDVGYYYGSLNFTAASMNKKVEVVSYCNTFQKYRASVPKWMSDTRTELLDFSIKELNSFNRSTHTANLGVTNLTILAGLNTVLTKILKYNPSIEKIEITLSNYEDVRAELSSIVDKLFPLVDFKTLDLYWDGVSVSINILDELAFCGNDIWVSEQNQNTNPEYFQEYNLLYSKFAESIESLILLFRSSKNQSYMQERIAGIARDVERELINYKKSQGID